MFRKIFNKRNSKSASTGEATTRAQTLIDKAAMKLVLAIQHMQNGFANFFNKRTKHFTASTWKILIVVFGGCWGLFSCYVFSSALLHPAETGKRPHHSTMAPHSITAPKRSDSLEWMESIYNERKNIKK